jgi:hypothetical protein
MFWEDFMKTYIVTLAAAVFATTASAAYAASTTVTINAIDANGVGKKIGTLRLSDTKEGLRVMPRLADLPPGDMDSMSTLIRIVVPATDRTASQRPAWQREAITTRLIPANILDHTARATRATCQC